MFPLTSILKSEEARKAMQVYDDFFESCYENFRTDLNYSVQDCIVCIGKAFRSLDRIYSALLRHIKPLQTLRNGNARKKCEVALSRA